MADKKTKPIVKQAKAVDLHRFIATGGKPKNYKGSKPGFK